MTLHPTARTTFDGKAEREAVADAAGELVAALRFGGTYTEVTQGIPPGGCQVRLMPSDAHPWTLGDVQGALQGQGIIANKVELVETAWLDPGPMLLIELPTAEDMRALGRLVETGLTPLQNAALQLHRALDRAEITRDVTVRTRVIELAPLTLHDSLRLYRRLGGDALALTDLDLDDRGDLGDHQRFADMLQELLCTTTGRQLLATLDPVCRRCRRNSRNEVVVDLLDVDDALTLAAALGVVSAAPPAPSEA
ncbi:hypothetical protein [Streptomyces sp. NBC_00102]|uniref:hypothetical protein n=1 Tax=Streptomyces sp. NBC_00102 TaxID=2975652 RepID=UPI00224D845E|nr:hypothetical protein [Streptomyces sp. NBC_00102]MCX5395581.1 hypothetical protein [Streptomyces sp. NBC_00102]